MAERRMFAKSIIDSDAFLDMPLSAQALYFHLTMRADDDGFVGNPKRIKGMIGASDDDLKLLLAKRFILAFESGVIVIKHWWIHNYIQKDRKQSTTYVEELETLKLDDKKAYTEGDGYKLDTNCIQNVSKMYTQSKLKEIKVKEIKVNNNGQAEDECIDKNDAFEAFWNAYPKKIGKRQCEIAFNRIPAKEHDAMMSALEKQKQSAQWTKDNGQYIPYPLTWLHQERWKAETGQEDESLNEFVRAALERAENGK